MREGGVEPPRPFGHTDLNRARLPIPPLARAPSGPGRLAVGEPERLSPRSPPPRSPIAATQRRSDHQASQIRSLGRRSGRPMLMVAHSTDTVTEVAVGVLDRFERRLDRMVNGAFARAFKAEVQPVEIASALQRECDDKAAIVATRPHDRSQQLLASSSAPSDYERLAVYRDALSQELADVVREHAGEQGYALRRARDRRPRAGRRPRDRHVPRRQPGRARRPIPRRPHTARRPPRGRRSACCRSPKTWS